MEKEKKSVWGSCRGFFYGPDGSGLVSFRKINSSFTGFSQTRNQNRESMASIKLKFRPSTTAKKEGTIYYQIIQNRIIRQLKTDYRLFAHEWDEEENSIIVVHTSRQNYLQSIRERIDWDIKRLQSIISQLEKKRMKYTADDIISTFHKQANEQSLFNFMQGVIARLQQMGKQRTSETYRCTLRSFMQFREDKDVLLEDLMTGKPLPYNGELYSDEHRRKFKTNDVTAKVGTNNGKLILTIDGLHIGEWFKKQFERLQQNVGLKPIQKKNKGFKL